MHRVKIKHFLMITLIALIFFQSGATSLSADSRETKRVLILYSLEKGNVGQERIDAQIHAIFRRNKTFNIKIYNEYLDVIRFPEATQISQLPEFLRRKYALEKPDVVITILSPALDFLELHRKELFQSIPVVAAFLPRERAESLARSAFRKRATSTLYADNAYEIAQSALMLIPGTKHIAFVAGTSPLDIGFKVSILKEIKRAAEGMELIDLSGLTIKETLSRVHNLPPDTVVFHISMFRDKQGVPFNPPDAHRMVSDASNAPVFGFVESHMGKGIVGGRLALLEWHVEKIAELTLRILAGESPEAIPIAEEGGYRTLYDWRELKRWEIPESSLPKGSIIINKNLNAFDRYKRYIIAGVLFLILQTVLVVFLISMNRKQKKTSVQLRESEERYRELLRVDRSSRLGELTASLAHELNQPLAAILSNAQAALRFHASGKKDPELFREIFQNIVQDDKRAADVIRSLRSMVKRAEARKDPVNINDVLREVIAITQGELTTHNILIETLSDETLPSVIADKTQIQQVALNLIMNAVDAMAQSPPDMRRIILQTEQYDGFVRVGVQDSGPGIPAEQVDSVFDPFYTTKSNGLGMGLAVCKSIITAHGGRIWAENNPEGGATLSFALKVANHD
jgi:signal transduction histidine kinase